MGWIVGFDDAWNRDIGKPKSEMEEDEGVGVAIDEDKIPYSVVKILEDYYGDCNGEFRYETVEAMPPSWELAVELGFVRYEYWRARHILFITKTGIATLNKIRPFSG